MQYLTFISINLDEIKHIWNNFCDASSESLIFDASIYDRKWPF